MNGIQDQSSLQETCQWLSENKYANPVVVKSTVLPGTCDQLRKDFNLKIVHNPEFLTAKSPYEDFMAQPAVLLSGAVQDREAVADVYYALLPQADVVYATSYATTEIAKYTHNLFLATKVGFLNEIHRVCDKMGVSFDGVITAAKSQGKIGENHTKVPGPDGLGFAGACFPKDIQALISWSKDVGIDLAQIEATNEANLKIRPDTKC